ncbi:hypothetical protein OsJ_05478 [Oryza sativa Japonica Group]|uniref:Uncharacterized protein n=1 Tax=Oryza sativa subsp. japonica TaxID=39947 RepID=B9F358_ORYSJ|nr:hypothetical protein OsJ_05478 [Oryza sativa Japonica Group]
MVLLVVTPPEPTRRVREEVEIYEERGGDVRTPSFADRLYGGGGAGNANSNSTDPPPLDAANLRERKCRTAGDGVVEMDPGSHLTFDLGYYRTTDHWKGMRGDRLFLETWRGEGGVLDRQGPGADAAGAWWRPAVVRRRALLASSRCRQGGAEVGRWRGGHHVVAAESRRLVASGATGTGVAPLGAARRWRGDPATYTLAV